MKAEVLQFLQNPPEGITDRFNMAFELYRRTPGKNFATERNLNFGYTDQGMKNLLYDLQKLHGITDLEVATLLEPVQETLEPVNKIHIETTQEEIEGNQEDNSKQIEENDHSLDNSPVALRTEYPFLNDPECPNELKILVADKITHYNAYRECHERLQLHADGISVLSPEVEQEIAANAVSHFEAGNKIKAELDHYATNKQLLGEHPIFAQLALQREVDDMTQDQLLKFVAQTPSYISKKNKDLKGKIDEKRKLTLENAIKDRNDKLALVNKKLGAGAGK